MEQQLITSKKYFKTLSLIYYLLIIGQTLLIIFAFIFQHLSKEIVISHKTQGIMTISISLIAFLSFSIGKFLFKNKLRKLIIEPNLTKKMQGYRSALIEKYTILLLASCCAIVATFITRDDIFLIFSLLFTLLFFIDKPSVIRAAKDLDLSPENTLKIKNSDAIIA